MDDYFAKKDKKKSKKKAYKAASSLLAAEGPATTKPAENAPVAATEAEKVKKPKGRIAEYNDDDNWDEEVAQEKKADFSGLKIASMTVSAAAEEAAEEVMAPEVVESESEDEAVAAEPGAETVDWATGETREAMVMPVLAVDPTMPNVAGGKYVPPSRGGAAARRRGPSQQAPDLGTMAFPTLGSAVAESKVAKERAGDEFQQVDRGGGGGGGYRAPMGNDSGRYQPPGSRGSGGSNNAYAGLDRRGNDGRGDGRQEQGRSGW
jgi:hypothetical protein